MAKKLTELVGKGAELDSAFDYESAIRKARGMGEPAALRLALTTQEACAALGISSVSLWRLEKRGLIRSVPHLRHKMWPVKELERFLAEGAVA